MRPWQPLRNKEETGNPLAAASAFIGRRSTKTFPSQVCYRQKDSCGWLTRRCSGQAGRRADQGQSTQRRQAALRRSLMTSGPFEEFLKPPGISQSAFAVRLGVSFPRLNEIIRGKRAVTPDSALRLARVTGMQARAEVVQGAVSELSAENDINRDAGFRARGSREAYLLQRAAPKLAARPSCRRSSRV